MLLLHKTSKAPGPAAAGNIALRRLSVVTVCVNSIKVCGTFSYPSWFGALARRDSVGIFKWTLPRGKLGWWGHVTAKTARS